MIARGNVDEAKRYLATLGWRSSRNIADRCWKDIKKPLKPLQREMEEGYIRNLILLKPSKRCHINDMTNLCKKCYHFKQLLKFLLYI
ncbi:hypothetical protein Bca52824_027607 [Brassica carinata]|uniref:Uncharacterized protein n=1 Tax=Brassica carinata TaxID=52824 RepID=A0A8X7VAT2_BRACI|nr:hypothetical protein Bca52824_027607 [Brassica carinata]